MPPFRSNPSSKRKKRFQGPGWCDSCGSLYFQLKRGAQNFSRAHEVMRDITMDQLIRDMLSDVEDDYQPLPDGIFFAFVLRKQILQPTEEKAFSIFGGGETVYVKVIDEDEKEYLPCYDGVYSYELKVRGRKPRYEDVVRTCGPAEVYRLGLEH